MCLSAKKSIKSHYRWKRAGESVSRHELWSRCWCEWMKSSPCRPSALTLGYPVHTLCRWPRKPLEQAAQPSHLLQAAVMGETAPKTEENPLLPRDPAAPGTPSRPASPTLPTVVQEASGCLPAHTGLTDTGPTCGRSGRVLHQDLTPRAVSTHTVHILLFF